jgi:hypothetical protein
MVTGSGWYGCAVVNLKTSDRDVVEHHSRCCCGEGQDIRCAVEACCREERLCAAGTEIEVSEQEPRQGSLVERVEERSELHRSFAWLISEFSRMVLQMGGSDADVEAPKRYAGEYRAARLAGAGTGQLHELDISKCSPCEQRVAVPPEDAAAKHLAVDERASEATSDEGGLVAEHGAKASAVDFLECDDVCVELGACPHERAVTHPPVRRRTVPDVERCDPKAPVSHAPVSYPSFS